MQRNLGNPCPRQGFVRPSDMVIKPNVVTVAEAAKALNISIDTIRRWEKKGLINARRSEHNHRLFEIRELERLALRQAGGDKTNRYRILKAKPSKFTSIELFAGAGGMALGLENAGLNNLFLNELNKDAVSTLKQNRPGWKVNGDDVHLVSLQKFAGKIDVLTGGFPCQAFSYAGQGAGFADARGTLFYEFARCVSELQPKIAIGENVRGLLRHDGGRTLQAMVLELESRGYRVMYKLLRAQFLDVPQKRERLLILAIRKDLDLPFLLPVERDYTLSMREALKGVPKSAGTKYPKSKEDVLRLVPQGGYWRDLPIDVQKSYLKGSFHLTGGKTGMARRLSWQEPSLTLTCSPAQKQTERCHPKETRPLTVREYARIQTFPDDWKFTGSVASQYKQIGNAVPVNLGYYIGRVAIGMLQGRWDDTECKAIDDITEERKWHLFS
jgi:DNA (cytosine-5)-methyltransferase 1